MRRSASIIRSPRKFEEKNMQATTFEINDGLLKIFPHGNIDTATAPQIEKEIETIKEENPHERTVLDLGDVSYVSSSGLRVVLRLKKAEPDFSVTEVSSEVYEIFEMTGFTEMMTVEKAMRRLSVDGCQVIGQGAKGIVYRWSPDIIVKVYKNKEDIKAVSKERELARKAFILGVPTAIPYDIVRVGDSYGSVFELLAAKSLSETITGDPENLEKYVGIYADLLRQIHSVEVDESIPDIRSKGAQWLDEAGPALTEDEKTKIRVLLDGIGESNTLLHCDYHTNNIMMQGGEAILIDMDTLSRGNPIYEIANIYTAYVAFGEEDPDMVEKFMGLPFETCKKIWELFLPAYFAGKDSSYINKAADAAMLLAYLRVIRHNVRRGNDKTEKGRAVIENAHGRLSDLLGRVESLSI